MRTEESWDYLAKAIGYSSEPIMLRDMYVYKEMSLHNMSLILGVDYTTVRKRLLKLGVKMRGQGGPRKMKRRLAELSNDTLYNTPIATLVARFNCHPSTVASERRYRKTRLPEL